MIQRLLFASLMLLLPSTAGSTTVLIYQEGSRIILGADTLLTTGRPPRAVGHTCKVRLFGDIGFVAYGAYTDTVENPSYDTYRLASENLRPRDGLSVEARIQQFAAAMMSVPAIPVQDEATGISVKAYLASVSEGVAQVHSFSPTESPPLRRKPCPSGRCFTAGGETSSFSVDGQALPVVQHLLEEYEIHVAFSILIQQEAKVSMRTGPDADILTLDPNGGARNVVSRCR